MSSLVFIRMRLFRLIISVVIDILLTTSHLRQAQAENDPEPEIVHN